jgi:hypothetical protein
MYVMGYSFPLTTFVKEDESWEERLEGNILIGYKFICWESVGMKV